MEPSILHQEIMDDDRRPVHDWRVWQLTRLGVSRTLAEVYADRIDWHRVAHLVQHGCPPRLALRIAA
jgi:hypothetical protein